MIYLSNSFRAFAPQPIVGQLERAEKILCDVDGCLISGDRVLPGAVELVRRFSDRLVLVSNNSTDTSATLSKRLTQLGLEISPQRIFLAGEAAVRFIHKEFGRARVYALASQRIREFIGDCGLQLVDDQPDVVLLCRDTDLSMTRVEMALRFISKGVPVVVSNMDQTHPGKHGPALETGALFAMLNACVEPVMTYRLGKPHPELFQEALGSTPPEQAIMIGDNPKTDGAGAEMIGMPNLVFGFGEHRDIRNFRDLFESR